MDIWTYRAELGEALELEGFTVEARDGEIGTVSDASFQRGGSWLVVDTGFLRKEVLLPAGVVERVDPDTRTVFVDRTKEEIENAPPFGLESRTPEDEQRLAEYYGGGFRASY